MSGFHFFTAGPSESPEEIEEPLLRTSPPEATPVPEMSLGVASGAAAPTAPRRHVPPPGWSGHRHRWACWCGRPLGHRRD